MARRAHAKRPDDELHHAHFRGRASDSCVSSRNWATRTARYGAKGIGELPMDGPAPAIVNAIEDALGIPFDSIPLLPEDIFEAVSRRRFAGKAMLVPAGVR